MCRKVALVHIRTDSVGMCALRHIKQQVVRAEVWLSGGALAQHVPGSAFDLQLYKIRKQKGWLLMKYYILHGMTVVQHPVWAFVAFAGLLFYLEGC